MPFCASEAQEQGDVRLKFRVIAGQLEQSVAEVILVQVTVLAPGHIRVGEMMHAVRLFVVSGSGKQLIPGVQLSCRSSPEPVHKVKV